MSAESSSGVKGWIRVKACTEVTKVPLPSANVSVRLSGQDGALRDLYLGETDDKGQCTASFTIPQSADRGFLVVDVSHERGNQQVKLPLGAKGKP